MILIILENRIKNKNGLCDIYKNMCYINVKKIYIKLIFQIIIVSIIAYMANY